MPRRSERRLRRMLWGDVAGGRREVEEDEEACFIGAIHNEEAVGDLQCDGVFCKLTEGGDRAQTELGSRCSFQDLQGRVEIRPQLLRSSGSRLNFLKMQTMDSFKFQTVDLVCFVFK